MMHNDENIPSWVQERRVHGKRGPKPKYPWATLKVGELFSIPVDSVTCSFRSFQVMAQAQSVKLNRKFFVNQNPQSGAFEIWRES